MLKHYILAPALFLSLLGAAAWAQTASDYNSAGIEHYNAKNWDAAIELFLQGYELSPDNPTIRQNLCNAYRAAADELAKARDLTSAAQLVELAISVDPENPLPLIQLGSYYLQMGHVPDAVFRLEEAVELAPDNVTAHELLGDAYYRDNDVPSALAEWELVAELDPNRKSLEQKLEKAYRENSVEGNFRRSGSRHFEISFPPGTPGRELNKVLTVLERAYRDIGRRFHVYPPAPIHVILYSAGEFTQATAVGDHVGALYDGKIRVPGQGNSGEPLSTKEFERRLHHEYVHVVVRAAVGDDVPWWVNEGLAETFSRDADSLDREMLREAVRKDRLFNLDDLEQAQLEKQDPEALRLAYTQAHATVRFLLNQFGQRGLNRMLSALADGFEPEEALKVSYRRTYDLLETEVVAAIRHNDL